MTRIAYVNGHYLPHQNAMVHIEDRGYQFADGVYEVIAFYNRTLVDGELHLKRLQHSLEALDIPMPMGIEALRIVLRELLANNTLSHGSVYLQVTRGVGRRDHIYNPSSVFKPSLVITLYREKPVNDLEISQGAEVILREDIRWSRRDIKSIALLPNVLLKNEAARLGKRETWLLDDQGYITEASVSNAFLVDDQGTLITRDTSHSLLPGITRHRILTLAKEIGINIELRSFAMHDIESASEAFVTSSTSHLAPIVKVENTKIGNGKPGPVFKQIFERYVQYIEQETGRRIWEPHVC